MAKKKSKWIEIVNEVIAERKAAGKPAGVKDALEEARKRYAPFKKKGTKGAPSITRPGKKDYRTNKDSKHYNRDGHWQDQNEEGKVGKPFSNGKEPKKTKRRRRGKAKGTTRKSSGKRHAKTSREAARLVLKHCKLCGECARQVGSLS